MDSDPVPFLLVTANVGSVFEDPDHLMKSWIDAFLAKVTIIKPQFVALHLQEVGGKTYEKSMEHVQEFIRILCQSNELNDYNKIQVYLDEDYTSAEHFTALGNLYFISKHLKIVKLWNFFTHDWEIVEGKNIHTGNIESVPTKEKSKFPQHFFPECKWSRKGFLRTRWEIKGTVIDMVNIHLFHDASNLAACEYNPSIYCKTRRRALVHTLERFHTDKVNGSAPYFVFGDFNFRCNTEGVIKKLTEDLSSHRIANTKIDHNKLQYRNVNGDNVLTIGKKEFSHVDHQTLFKEPWLRQFDHELDPLKEILVEYPITFPPTYPYEEDVHLPNNYMSTRCPAWCDRILMNPLTKDLIVDNHFSSNDYNIIGDDTCMGDHKPVYLNIRLKVFQGIVRCSCEHAYIQHTFYNDAYQCSITKTTKCFYTSADFYHILLDTIVTNKSIPSNPLRSSIPKINPKINITDAENEIVCMCDMYSSSNNLILNQTNGDDDNDDVVVVVPNGNGKICSQCSHIIKQQSTEHRKTLISKRLELKHGIIVNRVDTHLLGLTTATTATRTMYGKGYGDPYTPESTESHSPQPEHHHLEYHMDDATNYIDTTDELINEIPSSASNLLLLPPKSSLSLSLSNRSQPLTGPSISAPAPALAMPQQQLQQQQQQETLSTTLPMKGVSPSQLKSRLKNLQKPLRRRNNSIRQRQSNELCSCSDRCCEIM